MTTNVSALADSLKGVLDWQWDDRFEGVLAAFNASDKEAVLDILKRHFSQSWDSTTVSSAPAIIGRCTGDFGGVADGQVVFATDPEQNVILLGLWWPWNNGTTISLRLIPCATNSSTDDVQEILSLLKTTFGL